MTDNIEKPWGDYKTPGPNQAVIEKCRALLDRAEAGEIISVAIVAITPNDSTGTMFCVGAASFGQILGGVALLNQRILSEWERITA